MELKVVKEEDLPWLPFCGVHHVLQPPPDWPVEAWHEAREAVEDLFCNIINWFELSKDFKENAAMTNNEKYRNRFSNEEIQNAVLLFNRFRKSYEFLKKEEAPSSTTISNRTSFFRCQPGEVQYHLLDILKRKLCHLPPWQKRVSLVFDEVWIVLFFKSIYLMYIFFSDASEERSIPL